MGRWNEVNKSLFSVGNWNKNNVTLLSEDLHKKIQTALLQQTLLIRTSCYVLFHLSEDPKVEDKMRKKGITQMLVRILVRKHQHSSTNGKCLVMQS